MPTPTPTPGSAAPIETGSAAPIETGSAAPIETGSATPTETGSAAPTESGSAAPVETGATQKTGKTGTQKTGTQKAGTQVKTNAGSGSATTKVETPAVASTPIDSNTLAAYYKSVGAQLAALQQKKGADATSDLWPRYRFVNISRAMANQQTRDEANGILTKLASEIKARSK